MAPRKIDELFLRGVWAGAIPKADDTRWVDAAAQRRGTDDPCGDFGPLVRRMLDCGVTAHEIARFAVIIGYETAGTICYHLDDPYASIEGFDDADELGEFGWGLFEVDPVTDAPLERIGSLHEMILSLDPSGREMRPLPGSGTGTS